MTLAGKRAGRAWATNAVLCVLGLGLLLLAKQFVAEEDHFTIGFSGVSGWSVDLYLLAIAVILTQPVNKWTLRIVVGFAIAFQMVTLFAEPFLSSDIYRYVWDGAVQHAHVNPYRYVPGDPALTALRAPNQEAFDMMNRRDYARTIYPPVAQWVYWLTTFISPTVTGMKAAMVGFEVLTGWALLQMFALMGRRREELLLYCWCPLLVWEIGGAGHVDAAVFAFVALAMLFRYREQPVWTGLFLGLAVFTKFYPLVLFPALYKRGDWKMPAMVAAVGAVGYACYLSAGKLVVGFLFQYTKEEGIETGARFFLLELVQHVRGLAGMPKGVYLAFCAVVMGTICWWAWKHATVEELGVRGSGLTDEFVAAHPSAMRPRMDGAPRIVPAYLRATMAMAFAMMLLFSPHYPWYITWLVPLLALAPNLPLLAYVCGFFYLFTTALADPGPKMFLLNKILYGGVLVVFVLDWALRRFVGWGGLRSVVSTDEAAELRVGTDG